MPSLLTEAPITTALLRGAVELEETGRGLRPMRLPSRALAQCDDPQLHMVAAQPAGVRLVFRTAARVIELEVQATRIRSAGLPPRPVGRYDLCVEGVLSGHAVAQTAETIVIDQATGEERREPGGPARLRFEGLPARDKEVTLWLPHNEAAELLALRSDAPLAAVPLERRRTWAHHGSSISQGADAEAPSETWTALAASRAGVDLVNLGLGGNALLDPFIARCLRDLDAEAISLEIGINLVNRDMMRARAFGPAVHGMLDTIREGHPETPLLVVSPLLCPMHETTPGPSLYVAATEVRPAHFEAGGNMEDVAEGKLTLKGIRTALEKIVARRADPNLHYLDGRDLYGAEEARALPMPDALHPCPEAHRLIGKRFAENVFGSGGAFAG